MRGKQRKYDGISRILRITPAGAGKTKSFSRDVSAGQDHPRRCGENHFALTIFCTISGSPPQVRGKLPYATKTDLKDGITPAGAGKTLSSAVTLLLVRDHPRRCGENQSPTLRPRGFGGSPPQVRGKLQVRKFAHISLRITPAGAGKTPSALFVVLSAWDHPRRCGENVNSPVQRLFATGSPPQVRGKHSNGFGQDGWWRITPAGAGKTWGASDVSIVSRDHPRRCGENVLG